jgi:hypothetical protein
MSILADSGGIAKLPSHRSTGMVGRINRVPPLATYLFLCLWWELTYLTSPTCLLGHGRQALV